MAIINASDLKSKTPAELMAMVLAMQEEASKPRSITMKVTDKGGLSVYGLGRFPVTLYRGQWERLLAAKEDIGKFIETNKALLSVKDEAKA